MKPQVMVRKTAMFNNAATILLMAGIVCHSGGKLFAQASKYKFQETINLVNLVNDAASEISQKGEKAFKEFMTNGTRWRNAETYIFVCGLKGDIYVHEDPALIGKNEYDLKDVNGKPIVQWFIRKALGIGQCGWTHYEWVKPGKTAHSWKSTYVKLAKASSGTIYVVGSGLYDMRMEKEFSIDAVSDAMSLIRTMGKEAFPVLRDTASEFVYKDTYVFVLDTLYNTLVNPADPALEGKNQKDMKDAMGKFFIQDIVKVAVDNGQGWVDYLWPKPGTTKAVRKSSFVKRIVVRGEILVVGTGVYLD
ncbi:MAG: cache domain-containing protein [Bacteroidetes bacterium]|nr:cache domain-containing protein [Bacteroidota bacterium]